MIVMKEEDLHSQAGMERAFLAYCEAVRQDQPGTLNAMLAPDFVSCDWDKHTLVLRAAIQPWMANPSGILHGGITAAYLDLVMGLICRYCSGGRMTPTLHMDVSYLRSGNLGDTLCIRAEATKLGSTICYAAGSIYPEGQPDRLIATAAGSYFVTGAKP